MKKRPRSSRGTAAAGSRLAHAGRNGGFEKQYADEVQLAVATAQREPEPDPFREDWNATVWRPY